jgi:hypothetical protein
MLARVQRRWLDLTTITFGVVALVVALALTLWPLHGNGVSGNILAPRYSKDVFFSSYTPLPAHPTKAELRQAGITLPRDVVNGRREDAETLAITGVFVVGLGLALRRNARRPRMPASPADR